MCDVSLHLHHRLHHHHRHLSQTLTTFSLQGPKWKTYSIILYCFVLYCIVLYYFVLFCIILYCLDATCYLAVFRFWKPSGILLFKEHLMTPWTVITVISFFIHPSIHPSIHPFSSAYPGPSRGGSCLSRDTQTSLSPDTASSSSGRTPRRSQASWVT